MQLAARFPESSQVGKFSSVRAALGAGSPRPSPARRQADELRECTSRWLDARAELLNRGDELRAELGHRPRPSQSCADLVPGAGAAAAMAEDARLAAEVAEAQLGTG